eukprot:169493-Pyramimonas_sp.AAC.1
MPPTTTDSAQEAEAKTAPDSIKANRGSRRWYCERRAGENVISCRTGISSCGKARSGSRSWHCENGAQWQHGLALR